MANLWERTQAAGRAALDAWRGNSATTGGLAPKSQELGYTDGLTPDQTERLKRYALLWDYYQGRHKKPLKAKSGQPSDNVIINHDRRIVNKSAAFLFGKPLRWEIGGSDNQDVAEEDLLSEVWGSLESRMARLMDIAITGGVCGTVFVQLMPPDDRHPNPRVVNLNPALVFPAWNPDDIDEVWAYELRWRSQDKLWRNIYSLTENGGWEYWQERQDRGRWEPDGERATWPWDWSPILHSKNLPNPHEFYGLSDLEDADLGDAVNFVASNTNRTLRLFAHPQMWGYGFGDGEIVADPGRIIMARNPAAQLNMLQMQQSGASQQYMDALTTWYYQISQTPEMNPNVMSLGAQSGFALRVLYTDLLEKTGGKRNLYGELIVEVNRRLLDMLGKGPKVECKLHWDDPLPINEAERNATDGFEIEAGLASKETVRTRRGLDNEQELERLEAERQEAKKAFEEQQAGQNNIGAELLKAFEKGGAPEQWKGAQGNANDTGDDAASGQQTGGTVPNGAAQTGKGGLA